MEIALNVLKVIIWTKMIISVLVVQRLIVGFVPIILALNVYWVLNYKTETVSLSLLVMLVLFWFQLRTFAKVVQVNVFIVLIPLQRIVTSAKRDIFLMAKMFVCLVILVAKDAMMIQNIARLAQTERFWEVEPVWINAKMMNILIRLT
jgi:hypothetical protein